MFSQHDQLFNDPDLNNLRTGDVVFCSNNSPTGVAIKLLSNSRWTHVGIIVRMHLDRTICLDQQGSIFVMEINTETRYDAWTRTHKAGFGLTTLDFIFNTQNLVGIRSIKRELLQTPMDIKTAQFIENSQNIVFPISMRPFASLLFGWHTLDFERDKSDNMFCSEMMAYYYYSVFKPEDISRLIGCNTFNSVAAIAPKHFEPIHSPNSNLLADDYYDLHRSQDSLVRILAVPVLLTFSALALAFYLSGQSKTRKKK